MNNNRSIFRPVFLALASLGAVYLWRNRFQIQRFLEAQGLRTPTLSDGSMMEPVKSGIAKVAGRVENAIHGDASAIKRQVS